MRKSNKKTMMHSYSDSSKEELETRKVQQSISIDAPEHWLYALASFIVRSRPDQAQIELATKVLNELGPAGSLEQMDSSFDTSRIGGGKKAIEKFCHACRRNIIRTIAFKGGQLPAEAPGKVKARRKKLANNVNKLIEALKKEPQMAHVVASDLLIGGVLSSPRILDLLQELASRLSADKQLRAVDFDLDELDSEDRPFPIPQPGRKSAESALLERALGHEFHVAFGTKLPDSIALILDELAGESAVSITDGKRVAARLRSAKNRRKK